MQPQNTARVANDTVVVNKLCFDPRPAIDSRHGSLCGSSLASRRARKQRSTAIRNLREGTLWEIFARQTHWALNAHHGSAPPIQMTRRWSHTSWNHCQNQEPKLSSEVPGRITAVSPRHKKQPSHEGPPQMYRWRENRRNKGNKTSIKPLREETGYAGIYTTPSTTRNAPTSMSDPRRWKT